MPPSFADGLFWLSVACCAFAQFYILRSVGGGRHTRSSTATLPRLRGATEMLWAAVPAVGLAVLLVFTWRAMQARSAAPASRAPAAEVTR